MPLLFVFAGGHPPSLQQLQEYAESISAVIAPQGYAYWLLMLA